MLKASTEHNFGVSLIWQKESSSLFPGVFISIWIQLDFLKLFVGFVQELINN